MLVGRKRRERANLVGSNVPGVRIELLELDLVLSYGLAL
jgi:hypothetical protein